MNPGKLNKRIRFAQIVGIPNEYGGTEQDQLPVNCSTVGDPDVTWGSLEPFKQYNQFVNELGANVLNSSRILIIRYRQMFTPTKSMIFEDTNAGKWYTIHSITPYYPGTKAIYQNSQQSVYKDNVFVFILGIERE